MKILRRHSFLSLVLSVGVASVASAGSMPSMQVKVAKAGGKVVYSGSTDSAGAFHTAPLAPGDYTVQFNAKSAPKGGPFSIVLDDAGKGGSVANSVPGGKFTRGGVALKVEVGPKAMSLNGHVSPAGSAKSVAAAAGTPMPKDGNQMESGKKVKYEKGKKFVWVEGISSMGGHWALADSAEAKNADVVGKQAPGHKTDNDR
ncbi:MAG: hypothetical protein ACR2MW_12020 [Chthoniobacterales bacterium]